MTRPDPDDAVVEAMAWAIAASNEGNPDVVWDLYTEDARAALAAYRNVMGDDGK